VGLSCMCDRLYGSLFPLQPVDVHRLSSDCASARQPPDGGERGVRRS